MKTTTLILIFWAVIAWGQEASRHVWMEEPRATDEGLIYALEIDDFSDVLAIEVDLLHDSQQAPVLKVRQKAILRGFITVDNVIGDTLKIVLARAVALGGSGTFAEVEIENPGVATELGFVRVTLNAGQIPVEYEQVIPDVGMNPPSIDAGDFDSSGVVDFSDFFLFADHFGGAAGNPGFDSLFDMDEDGEIGFSDFFLFADHFGTVYR
ncbi:MAG: hypothetical protein HOC74_30585 [Gemmatimonadetes bacterium]|mgnify:CR=1 FL=1|jgi:hypothetical protein|nr:hypothetical protein [Gemmatimonadota bacterium]